MRRRTLEEKLEAIRLVEEGNSPRSVSDRLHIGHHQIYEWLYIYKEKGVSGLENKRICRSHRDRYVGSQNINIDTVRVNLSHHPTRPMILNRDNFLFLQACGP